jgi:hypothetical protein
MPPDDKAENENAMSLPVIIPISGLNLYPIWLIFSIQITSKI